MMGRRFFLRGVASLPFVGAAATLSDDYLGEKKIVVFANAAARDKALGQQGPIIVNAGMGANGREIGDEIVRRIRGYERRNGNGWRV